MRRSQDGFSLVEVMFSIAIFAVASLGVAKAFSTHLQINTAAERKSGAILAAQQVLDELRLEDPASFPSSGTETRSVTVGRRTFSVVVTYCVLAAYCSGTSRSLDISVLHNGAVQFEVQTVYAQLR